MLYPLPNDEPEQERDDMKHKLALWMMQEKLFYAPVEETLKRGGMVFDLGMLPVREGAPHSPGRPPPPLHPPDASGCGMARSTLAGRAGGASHARGSDALELS